MSAERRIARLEAAAFPDAEAEIAAVARAAGLPPETLAAEVARLVQALQRRQADHGEDYGTALRAVMATPEWADAAAVAANSP